MEDTLQFVADSLQRYATPCGDRVELLERLLQLSVDEPQRRAKSLQAALQRELERLPADRSVEYLLRLIDAIRNCPGGSDTTPLLGALAAAHEDESVRALSDEAARYFRSSAKRLWLETAEDQVSTASERAARLTKASEWLTDEGDLIQAIFNQLKGLPLAEDDQRMPALQHFLSPSQSLSLRVAVAFGIMQCLP
jgi:hypothetical protein